MRVRSPLCTAFLLAALVACGPRGEPADRGDASAAVEPAGPPPDTTYDPPPAVTCPTVTVAVSTADELVEALADAAPGDVIGLADGVYGGKFVATAVATASEPIFLCGGAGAILDGGSATGGYVLHLDRGGVLAGGRLTVRNGQEGVMADGLTHSVLQDLTVHHLGDEAIHLRGLSIDNVVRTCTVSDTGNRRDKFGEGIYVGTATCNWEKITGGEPDCSDRNAVLGNTITDTTAKSVDLKEGTSDGGLVGNTFDGSSLSGADSWVDVKGNGRLIKSNVGSSTPVDGFQTHEIEDGWGSGNVFAGNSGTALAQDDDEGVLIGLHPDRDTVVGCDNVVPDDSAPMTNAETCSG